VNELPLGYNQTLNSKLPPNFYSFFVKLSVKLLIGMDLIFNAEVKYVMKKALPTYSFTTQVMCSYCKCVPNRHCVAKLLKIQLGKISI